MDTSLARNLDEQVKHTLSPKLKTLGFERSKPSFWTRLRPETVQFIHLHRFRSSPAYRVHLGIRILNDDSSHIILNGLATRDGWHEADRKYSFSYHKTEESVERCANEIFEFCRNIGSDWFERFTDVKNLLNAADSPLIPDQKLCLERVQAVGPDPGRVEISLKLLGLAKK